MIKRSNLVAILSAVTLALTMSLVSACGGGGKDNSIVGYWELVSVTGADSMDEAMVAELAKEGMPIGLEATEDNKVAMNYMGTEIGGVWSGEDGTYKLLFVDQDIGTATVDGDKMTVATENGDMVFKRGEKPAGQPAATEPEDTDTAEEAEVPAEPEPAEAGSSTLVGTWKLTGIAGDDEFDTETLALLEQMDMQILFLASSDGLTELDFMGETLPGTWTESGGEVTLVIAEESITPILEGNTLKITSDGVEMTFEKTSDEDPTIIAASGEIDIEEDTTDSDSSDSGASNSYPAFGETVELPSGIELTVSGPKKYKLSSEWLEETYPADKGDLVVFSVTVKNGSSEELDGSSIYMKVVSDGQEGTQIWDSAGGAESPSTTILPGKSLKYKAAFQVADRKDIQFSWEFFGTDDGKVHYLTDN